MVQADGTVPGQGNQGVARLAALAAFAAILLTLGISVYFYVDLNAEVRDLRRDLDSLAARCGTASQDEIREEIKGLQAELEERFRKGLERFDAHVREASGQAQQKKPDLDALSSFLLDPGEADQADSAEKKDENRLTPYSFEIIQITQFDMRNGEEVIYTKKSNLSQFFTSDKLMRIVSTHMFQVWQDYYLLVIFRE